MRLAFGDMHFEEIARSVELFAQHVAPVLRREFTPAAVEPA
jgi:hypothetical protein